jgi:hypothetical protein
LPAETAGEIKFIIEAAGIGDLGNRVAGFDQKPTRFLKFQP